LARVRARLDNDPLYKCKNLENVSARLDNDPLYKGKNFERAVDRKNRYELKKGEWDNLKEYKLSIREGPTHRHIRMEESYDPRLVKKRRMIRG